MIACSTDANQGMDGPFILERIDYLGGYGAAAYSDIVCAGYVTSIDAGAKTVTLGNHTHFGAGKGTISELSQAMVCIDPGNDDSNYTTIGSASYGGSGEIIPLPVLLRQNTTGIFMTSSGRATEKCAQSLSTDGTSALRLNA